MIYQNENCGYEEILDDEIFCPRCGFYQNLTDDEDDDKKDEKDEDHEKEIDLSPTSSRWKRLLNFIIDGFPLMFAAGLVASTMRYSPHDPDYTFLLFIAFLIPYYLLSEGMFGQTLGKVITGTIVVDSETFRKASFGKVLGRTFSRLIPFDGISFLFSSRGWHDSIPNTTVINIKDYKVLQNSSPNLKSYFPWSFSNEGIRRLLILIWVISSLAGLVCAVVSLFDSSLLIPSIVLILLPPSIWMSCVILCWLFLPIVWIYRGFRKE